MKAQHKSSDRVNGGKPKSSKIRNHQSKSNRDKHVRPLAPKQFVDIIEHMNDGVVVLDKDWHYVYANQKAAIMLQREKPSDLIGKHIWTEFPEGVGQPFHLAYEKAMKEQESIVFEEHYEPWDLWFENRVYPSPDSLMILFTEITERKRMERLLEERQHLLQKIVDTEPGTVYIYDLEEHRNVYVNRHWLSEFGYTAEETQAMGDELLVRIFHPDDLSRIATHHENWRQADESDIREIEYRIRAKTGEWRWVHSHEAAFVKDELGRVTQILGIAYEITPRKLAQEALRRSEQQLELIYDSVSDIIFLLCVEPDNRYRFVSVNKAFLQATGLRSDQVIDQYADEIIPPSSHQLVFGNYKRAIQERVPIRWEEVSEYPSGKKTAIVTVNAVYDEENICTHLVGAVHDITERKQMEEEILKERDFSYAMFNSLPGVFYFYDHSGKFLRWNKNFEVVSGYSAEEIAQMHPLDFFEGQEKEYIAERIQQVFERGESDAEANFTAKNHELFPYYFTGKRIDIEGRPYLIGMGIDISQRRQAEEALRESETRYRAVVENQTEFIVRWKLDGTRTFVNEAYCRYFGLEPQQALSANFLPLILEEDRAAVKTKISRLISGESRAETDVHRVIKPDGSIGWQEWVDQAIYDEDGQIVEFQSVGRDVTERILVENALRESEEKFSKVFYASPIPLNINRMSDGRYVEVNESFLKRMGYQRDEVLGKTALDLGAWVHPEQNEKMFNILREDGSLHNFEAEFRTKSGEIGTALLFRETVELAGEKYFIGTNLDITERKRTEDALAASEAEFRALFAAMDDVLFIIDRDGVYRKVAPTNPRLLYKPREELLGMTVQDVFPAEQAQTFINMIGQVLESQQTARIEYQLIIDGHEVWFDASLSAMDRDSILWMARDITERKRAEQENRKLLHTLGERVKELTTLHRSARIQQQEGSDTLAALPELTSLLPPAFQYPEVAVARIRLGQLEAMTSGFEASVSVLHTEFTTADGQTGSIEVGYTEDRPPEAEGPFLVEERALIDTLADMLRTSYDRKRAEESLKQLNEELEGRIAARTEELAAAMIKAQESDRLKSAFLATMSHELRTPLNSIIGFTGVILQGLAGPLTDEQAKQLKMTRDSAHHLLALINDVLDISKIEAGQLEIVKRPFDMRQAIENVLRVVQPLLQKKDLKLRTSIGFSVGTLNQDRRRVEQVLINLVNNAIKFTERGEVRIECQMKDNCLETCVRDTGLGIRSEDIDRLFKPFQQLETGLTRSHEGSGLGLSICKHLVIAMGGEISVESQWGVGSAFKFTLPT